MAIKVTESGAVTVTGRASVELYRLLVLRRGLELEVRCPGMQMTRGRSCYAIVKAEFGFKGNREKVLDQLVALINTTLANRGVQEAM